MTTFKEREGAVSENYAKHHFSFGGEAIDAFL